MDAFTLTARLILNKDEFDRSYKGVEGDLGSAEKQKPFSNWGATMGRLASQAFLKIFRSGVKFAESIITTGMDFDAMMSQVKAVGNMTDEQFEAARAKAIELGKSTKYTSEQVGEAMYYMAIAGWKTEDMLQGIDGVLNLAAASNEDLATTSDIVTDALTAMQYQAEDTGHFVDVLAAASSNSNTTVSMMGEAFKYVAPVAGLLKYSAEDVSIALGLLANNGIKASQAGTSLRNILNRMMDPTEDAQAALDRMGLSLYNADGSVRSLKDVLGDMRTAFINSGFDPAAADVDKLLKKSQELTDQLDAGKITEEEYAAAHAKMLEEVGYTNQEFLTDVSDIAGVRGLTAIMAIMKTTDEDWDKLSTAVENADGTSKRMAAQMLDNLKGDLTLLNSAMDGLKILISDEYKGYIRDFVQFLTEEIGALADAFNEGGLAGMFTNLVDWVIDGMTTVLSNPDITVEGANDFGRALGDFVGHLVAKLIESAPELIQGLFQAGINLAGGLVQGLFEGLFGTGEGTVYSFMRNAEDERDGLISEANATATEAQGIVRYMETLVEKYGEAASESDEWATSIERLEQLIPGITASIKEEGQELATTTQNLSENIEMHRKKAIEDAKNAYIEDIWSKYETAQIEAGKAEIKRDIAAYQQEEAVRSMARLYLENRSSAENQRAYEWAKGVGTDADALINYTSEDEILQAYREGRLTYGTLYGSAINNENYQMTEDYKNALRTANESFLQSGKDYEENSKQIDELTESAKSLKIEFDIAKAAAERMANELGGDLTGETPHAQAKGDWFVPYDNYPSLLHRGEMVLTASQARKYRDGEGSSIDYSELRGAIISAVQEGMATAHVNAYMDGRAVTEQVSRQLDGMLQEARFA